MTNLTHRTNV